jgi:hypothetical protein
MGKWTGFFVKRWALWVFLLEIVFWFWCICIHNHMKVLFRDIILLIVFILSSVFLLAKGSVVNFHYL